MGRRLAPLALSEAEAEDEDQVKAIPPGLPVHPNWEGGDKALSLISVCKVALSQRSYRRQNIELEIILTCPALQRACPILWGLISISRAGRSGQVLLAGDAEGRGGR